jgi:hypothetical protein
MNTNERRQKSENRKAKTEKRPAREQPVFVFRFSFFGFHALADMDAVKPSLFA